MTWLVDGAAVESTAGDGASGGGASGGGACGAACQSRRTLLAAAGVAGVSALLGGCQTYGADSAAPPVTAGTPAGQSQSAADTGDPAGSPAASDQAKEPPAEPVGEALANVSDIPVGGGVVFADKGVVVTCPKEGTVKAFSTNCPHAGCAVNEVTGGTINCPCHGSKFRVADGSVAAGPAARALAAVQIKVDGDSIRLT